ncbi:actin [Ceratobasidium sp. AG-Ba]|nr:actin [Ceratobasidium sp. AG-Ba]
MASGVPSTPTTSRVQSSSIQASPHYTTTRRHSLYGTEDRIILDPGSRVWKVGFSGEGKPRDVFAVDDGEGLWNFNQMRPAAEREEVERLIEQRIQSWLRKVFYNKLLVDPKARKVIIVEHPLLPLCVKNMFAKVLFQNLQAPSLSFAPSHVLALLAAGRVTGLVLDCGHLETTVLPVFSSRPLFPQLCTTPLAGARLTTHIRALLLSHGTYIPPQATLSGPATSVPAMQRATRIPAQILTDSLIETIKTRACFVGDPIPRGGQEEEAGDQDVTMMDAAAPSSSSASDVGMFDTPPASEANFPSGSVSGASSATGGGAGGGGRRSLVVGRGPEDPMMAHSSATDLKVPVGTGAGRGVIIVPGWIRERAAEVLFMGGDVDERSVAETVLDSLRKVPVDLRKELISSILVVGGTTMLPGFIPRLHAEIKALLSPTEAPVPDTPPLSEPPSPTTPTISTLPRPAMPPRPPKPNLRQPYDPYIRLRQLGSHLAILNAPLGVGIGHRNSGKAPAFAPAAFPWVGGSLAGSLKMGGEEIVRERYDESVAAMLDEEPSEIDGKATGRREGHFLPDWTKGVMVAGAPNAGIIPPAAIDQTS